MKRYYIFALTILLSVAFYSCKEEDDSPVTGDGGALTGVWTLLNPSTENPYETGNASYGLNIKSDGKIQTVKIQNNKTTNTRDYAIGMIMKFNGNSFTVKGINKDGQGQYKLDTTIRIVDNKKFVPYVVMNISSSVFGKESFPDLDANVEGRYLKDYDLNSGMSQLSTKRDANLYGDWTLQDKDLNTLYSFSADGMSINNNKVLDWCTLKGELYVLQNVVGIIVAQKMTYSISGNTLKTNSSATGNRTFTKGKPTTPDTPDTPIVGNPGTLAGAWMRMNETGSYRIVTDYGYYGFQINTDGKCLPAVKDFETYTVSTTSETPLFTITSADNGYYTAVTSDGITVSGTYENRLSLSLTDYGSSAYDRLYIKTCSSNVYIDDSHSLVGYYSRVTNADGTSYYYDCTPYEVVDNWYFQYYEEYYDDYNTYHYYSYTKTLSLDYGGTGTANYNNNGTISNSDIIWACYDEDSYSYIILYYYATNKTETYQYYIKDYTLYLFVNNEWIQCNYY